LKEKHKGANTGLAAFYIKVGMLEKKYVEGENMHTHISFLTTENRKLGNKAFDDEFLAQVLLMSLPRDSTWETLVVALLQTSSDKSILKSVDVSSRLMQEFRRLTGPDPSDTALIAASRNAKSGCGNCAGGKKKKKRCGHCGYIGHTADECKRKKAEDEGKEFKSRTNKGTDKRKAPTDAGDSDGSTDSEDKERSNYAAVYAEFPCQRSKFEDDSSIHVF
jgi:hypothetical protein